MPNDIINLEVRVLFEHPLELCDEFLIDNHIVDFLNFHYLTSTLDLTSRTNQITAYRGKVNSSEACLPIVVDIECARSEHRLSTRQWCISSRKSAVEAVGNEFEFSASGRNIFNFEEFFPRFYTKVP